MALFDDVQESVRDDVKVVMEFAQEQKLIGSQPGEGDRETYDQTKAEAKFKKQLDCKGMAGNIFALNLDKWAVKGQKIPRHAAKAYGDNFVMPAARSQDAKAYLQMLKHPIGIAVVGQSPGPAGQWRRISMDWETFGFIVSFADLIRKKPFDSETKILIDKFKKACLHCPMDFYYFEASGNLESQIFRKSFEIMEEFRKTEERHAPGGWQVCCLFSAARDLQKQQSISAAPGQANETKPAPSPQKQADDAQSVCRFFDGFDFAQTSEYKNLDKKLSKDCLLVHERMVQAGVEKLLTGSWARLGHKNSLDGLYKLITISQRVASACGAQLENLSSLMKFVVTYTYIRMCTGSLDSHLGIRALRQWLTVPLIAFKVIQYVRAEYKYTKQVESRYVAKFLDPETWYANNGGSQPGDQHRVCPS